MNFALPGAGERSRLFYSSVGTMDSRRRIWNAAWRICTAVCLCAAAGVPAQTVYKQVDDAGNVTYTDRPDTTSTPSRPMATVSALDVARALATNTPISSRGAALIDANEAARRLEQAELERKQGAERLPGEQAQGADANAANHRYSQRQEDLRRMVEQAQRRSNETDRSFRARL